MPNMKIDETEYKGHKIERWYDECAESPRESCTNLGRLLAWHRGYNLNDDLKKVDSYVAKDVWPTIRDPAGFREWLKEGDNAKTVVVLPVYMHDHSSVHLSTKDFNDSWDSGQVGWIYTTHNAIKAMNEVTEVTPDLIEGAKTILKQEIETYGAYVNGEVYGYRVLDADGNAIDSCWGFIGDDGDDDGYMMGEAKSFVDHHLAHLAALAMAEESEQESGNYAGHS